MSEILIKLSIEKLPEGQYLATSDDVPGLVAQGRTLAEAVEIAQDVTRKIIESYLEHGEPLPPSLQKTFGQRGEIIAPVSVD